MAYDSGVFSGTETTADIIDLLTSFMTTEGWTINASSGSYVSASAGDCHVNLTTRTSTTVPDTYGPGAGNVPDHRIEGRLRASNAPFSSSDILNSSARVVSNDWTPPYANYWLFSGDDPDAKYVHLVVQKANGRFCSLSFGTFDKKGAVYDGGAFLTGMYWHWWFQSATANNGDGSDIGGSDHYWFGHTNAPSTFASYNVFLGDLDSDVVITNNVLLSYTNGKLASLTGRAYSMAGMASSFARWLTVFFFLGPNPLNGVTPLMEVMAMRYTGSERSYMMGTLPGIRWCSMIGRAEAETVAFGSDEYMVFPFKRALAWLPEPRSSQTITSGPLGMAIKKIV